MFSLKAGELPFFRTLTQWTGRSIETEPVEVLTEETAGINTIEGILEADSEKTPDTVFSKGVLEINTAILITTR